MNASHCFVWLAYPCPIFDAGLANLNTLRPRQNGRHFADGTFKRIFLNENVRILIKVSLKFVPKSPMDNIPALFQIMAWHRPGDKPLSETMVVRLLTHCVARPQWVKTGPGYWKAFLRDETNIKARPIHHGNVYPRVQNWHRLQNTVR